MAAPIIFAVIFTVVSHRLSMAYRKTKAKDYDKDEGRKWKGWGTPPRHCCGYGDTPVAALILFTIIWHGSN